MNDSFTNELEEMIKSLLGKRDKIDVEVNGLLAEKKIINEQINQLNNTYFIRTGKNFEGIGESPSASDLAEILLKEFGELHVDKMLELMAERKMLVKEIPKQSLVATLVRYSQQNKRFKRVKNRPNTFALIKEERIMDSS